MWCGYWSLAAILFLLPNNRTPTSVSSAITGMSSGEPSAYSHFLNSFGNHFGSGGVWTTWLLAIGSLVVGFGPLVFRRPTLFLAAGGLLATFFWVSGQGLGGIFTGSGTDPNSGPLIVLLALAMVPAALPDPATWRSPFSTALFRYPVLVLGGLVALVAGLFLSAAYPAAAQESTSTAMAGMTGMSGATSGSGGDTATTATCTRGNNGAPRTGLDVQNTPNMVMAGPGTGMNMNGADASAAAGLNTTKSNWHYTGPALPTAEAQELLAQGANGPTDIHMAAERLRLRAHVLPADQRHPVRAEHHRGRSPLRQPRPRQWRRATSLASPTDYPVSYYVNPTIVAANAAAKRTLDPNSIDGLVYAQTPAGTEVLAAAMYILPSYLTTAPMPYGPLVQWHQRTNTCGPSTVRRRALPFNITGIGALCPRHGPEVHAVHDDGLAGARGRGTTWPSNRPTSRSSRRPPCRPAHRADSSDVNARGTLRPDP